MMAQRHAIVSDLQQLVRWLEHGGVDELTVFGSTDERDWLVRLGGLALVFVMRHEVDDRGRCRLCRPRRAGCRRWLGWPWQPAPCLVHSVSAFFCTGPLDSVWWQTLAQLGDRLTLADVRTWLDSAGYGRHAE